MPNQKLSLEALGRLSIEEYRRVAKHPISVVLDNLRSMHNVGAFFRTCDAFRIECLYLTGITGKPPHKEIYKAALGAEQSVKWEYYKQVVDLVGALKQAGYKIILVEQTMHSIPLHTFKYVPKTCLVFGNEVDGVSEGLLGLADTCVEIPQFGTKHSLNVSVAGGIVLYHCVQQIINS